MKLTSMLRSLTTSIGLRLSSLLSVTARAEYDIAPSQGLEVMIKVADEKDAARIEANKIVLTSLAKLDDIKVLADGEATPESLCN